MKSCSCNKGARNRAFLSWRAQGFVRVCSTSKCIYYAVRYWHGRGDAISVLSGLVTTPSRFQWEERVVYERCTVARRAKMHNACLRNCQRCSGRPRAASLHLFALRGTQSRFFVWFARARIILLAAGWWIEACPPDSIRISEPEWPAKYLSRNYFFQDLFCVSSLSLFLSSSLLFSRK